MPRYHERRESMYFEKGIHGSHAVFGLNLCIQSCDLDLIYDEVERRM